MWWRFPRASLDGGPGARKEAFRGTKGGVQGNFEGAARLLERIDADGLWGGEIIELAEGQGARVRGVPSFLTTRNEAT
eukprot:2047706-Pyramimonas_sp.AAC.1